MAVKDAAKRVEEANDELEAVLDELDGHNLTECEREALIETKRDLIDEIRCEHIFPDGERCEEDSNYYTTKFHHYCTEHYLMHT